MSKEEAKNGKSDLQPGIPGSVPPQAPPEAKAAAKAKRLKKVAKPVPLGQGTVNDHEERLVAIENKLGL